MRLVRCNLQEHGSAILRILNDAIVSSTALYDYEPRPLSSMTDWFEAKRASAFPVWGALGDDNELLGFASYGAFRVRPAYKYTVEHSVYVDSVARGRGVGTRLMRRLIDSAVEQEKHVLVGGIDAGNVGSLKFHEALGFEPAGVVKQAGFKFGRWLDLAFYQLILPTPRVPVDG
ncbi:MAG: family N-acetyltransferase [Polyangiaceae bacterium]|jgi:phosphinothricin acetyltransferase|nr:family N-acetyltransferase [Polyangiaceae bacterium]